jgi:hypothetical protein
MQLDVLLQQPQETNTICEAQSQALSSSVPSPGWPAGLTLQVITMRGRRLNFLNVIYY